MSYPKSIVMLGMLSACGLGDVEPNSPTENVSATDEIAPTHGEVEPAESDVVSLSSSYDLDTQLDLTIGAIAPGALYDFLNDVNERPGDAIVTAARLAGVPAAEELFEALPKSLQERLGGWMTDAIETTELAALLAWSRVVLVEATLHSQLTILEMDAEGAGRGTHTLLHVTFVVDGRQERVAIPAVSGIPGTKSSEVELWLETNEERQELIFGEQRFGLLIGQAAYEALNNHLRRVYDTDFRGMLGEAVSCPAVAEVVADKCVLGVCVGHANELASLCEAGLDELEAKVMEQFRSLDMEVLRLASGEAQVVDGEFQNGVWAAEADLGQGLRPLPAVFSGQAQ